MGNEDERSLEILSRLDVMDSRLVSIDKHLEKQNGRMDKDEESIGKLDNRLIRIETHCQVVGHYDEKEHNRMEKKQEENRKSITELVKQYGAILLSVLLLLDMIGGWLGWFTPK